MCISLCLFSHLILHTLTLQCPQCVRPTTVAAATFALWRRYRGDTPVPVQQACSCLPMAWTVKEVRVRFIVHASLGMVLSSAGTCMSHACVCTHELSTQYCLLFGSGRVFGRVRIACWLEHWTCDWKVVSSNPGRSGGRFFLSRVNFVCWLSFGVHSTPVLLQWHVKYPGHSAKSADDRSHLNAHASVTQRSQSGLTMPLSRHSVGTYPETAYKQLVREYSATIVSACSATVDWSLHKEWN